MDPPPLNFLSSTFNNHILSGSNVSWQPSEEAADGCVIVQERKNPKGFYGSSCRPQSSNGYRAHHSRIFDSCNCVDWHWTSLKTTLSLTPFCSLLYQRYWDRQGLLWDFQFLATLVPGPISGLSKLQMPLKHRTTAVYNWDLGMNMPVATKKWCDFYQNMPIMLSVPLFKNGQDSWC